MTVTTYYPDYSLHGSQFVTMLLKLEVPRVKRVTSGVTPWAQSTMDISPS